MSSHLLSARDFCRSCTQSAKSQPSAPPTLLDLPEFPFQKQCADFAKYSGVNYLVLVDIYTGCGWLSIYKVVESKGLIEILKEHFATFGFPDELYTDSGPELLQGQLKVS